MAFFGSKDVLPVMQQAALQSEQDALLAEQQAAMYAEQQAAMVDELMRQEQQAAMQAQQMQGLPQDELTAEFMQRSGGLGAKGVSMDNATLWNREALDTFMQEKALQNGWNELQTEANRNKLVQNTTKALGKNIFEVEQRGFFGRLGDFANTAIDGFAGSLAELGAVGVVGAERLLNKAGVGDGTNQWGHTALTVVQGARDAWRALRSDESQDAEKARQQAEGMSEMLKAIGDNPETLTDEIGYMLGMLFGAKGAGAVAKGAGTAAVKRGALGLLENGASVSTKTLGKAGVTDELLVNAAKAMANSSSMASALSLTNNANRLRIAGGTALQGVGNTMSRLDPLLVASLSEGADAHNSVLRTQGTYDELSGTYTDDALNTALAAGALTGGITYGMGKLGGTLEGTLSRSIAGTARRASSPLAHAVVDGERVALRQALDFVTADLSKGASAATVEAIHTAQDLLTREATRTALFNALSPNAAVRGLFKVGGTMSKSMLAEGTEEGLIGLVTSFATQAIADDGKFDASKVSVKKLINDAMSAATLGATLGVLGGSIELSHNAAIARQEVKQDLAALQDEIDGLRDDVALDLATTPTADDLAAQQQRRREVAERSAAVERSAALERLAFALRGREAQVAEDEQLAEEIAVLDRISADTEAYARFADNAKQRSIEQDLLQAHLAEMNERAEVELEKTLERMRSTDQTDDVVAVGQRVKDLADKLTAAQLLAGDYRGVEALIKTYAIDVPEHIRLGIEDLSAITAVVDAIGNYRITDKQRVKLLDNIAPMVEELNQQGMKQQVDQWIAQTNNDGIVNQTKQDIQPDLFSNPEPVVDELATPNKYNTNLVRRGKDKGLTKVSLAVGTRRKRKNNADLYNRSIPQTFSVAEGGRSYRALAKQSVPVRRAVQELLAYIDEGLPLDEAMNDPIVRRAVESAANTTAFEGDVDAAYETVLEITNMVLAERGTDTDTTRLGTAEIKKLALTRYGDSESEAAQRVTEAMVENGKPPVDMHALVKRISNDLPKLGNREYRKKAIELFREKYADTYNASNAAYLADLDSGKTYLPLPLWDLVRSKEFKAWFGDWENDKANASAVTHAFTGEPLLVFHGGKNADYDKFLTVRPDYGFAYEGMGTYFTDSIDIARTYARKTGNVSKDKNVYPVFLNIRNPLSVDFEGRLFHSFPKPETLPPLPEEYADYGIENRTDGIAIAGMHAGYDGAIMRNIIDGNTSKSRTKNADNLSNVYVIYDANQAKSIYNNGAFSSDESIYLDNAWDSMTATEQTYEVLAKTESHYREWISQYYGSDMLDRIVFVSPDAAPNKQANGYTLANDPSRIFIVLHAGRTKEKVLWTVAHELLHNGMSVYKGNTVIATSSEYNALLKPFATNPTVKQLMDKMAVRYPNTTHAALVEEALAEIYAAQHTKRFDILEQRWGVKLPTALRVQTQQSIVGRIVAWIKRFINKMRGKSGKVSDYDVNTFIREVTNFDRNVDGGIHTPADMATYIASHDFNASMQRVNYYHELGRKTIPNFDALTNAEQRNSMAALALERGDTLAANELRFDMQEEPRSAAQGKAKQKAFYDKVVSDATQQAEKQGRSEPTDDDMQRVFRDTLNTFVQTVYLYPNRAGREQFSTDATEYPVGMVSFINANGDIRVRIKDEDNGIDITREFPFADVDTLSYHDALMHAMDWVDQRYPNLYRRAYGAAVFDGQMLPKNDTQFYRLQDQVILNRVAQKMIDTPALRRVVDHFRRYLPERWLPAVDGFLDFMLSMQVHWVDNYAVAKNFIKAYNKETGNNENIVEQLLTDEAKADAWLARNTAAYREGYNTSWETMTYKDGMDSVYDAIVRSGLSKAQVLRDLTAIEEYIRYTEMVETAEEELAGVDPVQLGERPREHVTGFRYVDWATTDMRQGAADAGAYRWRQDFLQRSPEERAKLGEIVAAIAAVNRAVTLQEKEHGVIDEDTAILRNDRGLPSVRGKGEDRAVGANVRYLFEGTPAADLELGGFFLSMRDEDSNPYMTGTTHGRTSVVDDPLAVTQRTLRARVRRAFANKELSRFALLVLNTPNRHFSVSPAIPVYVDGTLQWEDSDKDAKASVMVTVDGVPLKLVAKTKQAAAMIKRNDPADWVLKVGYVNHLVNATKTSYNLAYIPVGFTRDLLTGFMNINGAIGEQYVPSADAHKVGFATMKYALQYLPPLFKHTAQAKGYDAYEAVFNQRGMGMFFGDRFNSGTFRGETVTLTSRNPLLQTGKRIVEAVGYAPETAVRLGAFRAYMEYLYPELRSGEVTSERLNRLLDDLSDGNQAKVSAIVQATKRITTNFQQHGADNIVRFLFSFNNATLQGTFQTLPSILSTEHGRKSLALLMMATAVAAVYGIADEEEDAFGNSKYFHNVKRNRSITLGDMAIPMPDEAGAMRTTVENVIGLMMLKRNPVDAVMDVLHSSADMLTANQLGNTGNLATDVLYGTAPTLTHGFIGLATGKDIFGNALKREYVYDANGKRVSNAADVERSTARATHTGQALAEFIYGMTSGGVDMSGDEVDFFLSQYLGGAYRTFARTQTASMRDGSFAVADGMTGLTQELTRGFQAVKIDRQAGEAWEQLKERVGVSMRRTDLLNRMDDTTLAGADKLVKRVEQAKKQALSDRGHTMKYVRTQLELATKDGRSRDIMDLTAELRSIYTERRRIEADGIREAIIEGYIQ